MAKFSGIQLVLFTALISGVSIFANKFAVSGIDAGAFVLLKNLGVALALAALLLVGRSVNHLRSLSRTQWLQLVLVGLVGGSIPFLLFFQGLQLTSSPAATLIHKSMFVFVSILAALFLKEKFDERFYLPAGMLLVGNILLLGGAALDFTTGNLMVFAAMLLWAVENVYSKHLLQTIDATVLAFGRMFFGGLFVLAYVAYSGHLGALGSLSLPQWEWVAVTSFLLLGYVLTWYHGLKSVSVTPATCVLLLGAPLTSLLNLLYSGTMLTAGQVGGALLLVLGVGGALYLYDGQAIRLQSRSRSG